MCHNLDQILLSSCAELFRGKPKAVPFDFRLRFTLMPACHISRYVNRLEDDDFDKKETISILRALRVNVRTLPPAYFQKPQLIDRVTAQDGYR
jgi:hypothetical protein